MHFKCEPHIILICTLHFLTYLDNLDYKDEGEGQRDDDQEEGEDGEGHGADPGTFLAAKRILTAAMVVVVILQGAHLELVKLRTLACFYLLDIYCSEIAKLNKKELLLT